MDITRVVSGFISIRYRLKMILTLRKFSLCFSFFSFSFFSDFLSLSGFSLPLSLYCSVTDSILSVIDLKNILFNYLDLFHKYLVTSKYRSDLLLIPTLYNPSQFGKRVSPLCSTICA